MEEIPRDNIDRMMWFRTIRLGTNYYHEPALAVPQHIHDAVLRKLIEEGLGDTLKTRMRDYLHFTLAWVIDDGSAKVNESSD